MTGENTTKGSACRLRGRNDPGGPDYDDDDGDDICENAADGATGGGQMRLACVGFSLYSSHKTNRVFPIKAAQ